MKIGVITGTVVSTVKYERYRGMKMLKARNLTLAGEPTGEEFVVLDAADAGIGDIVELSADKIGVVGSVPSGSATGSVSSGSSTKVSSGMAVSSGRRHSTARKRASIRRQAGCWWKSHRTFTGRQMW